MATAKMRRKRGGEGECLSDDLLFRYTNGKATEGEVEFVHRHLNNCETCLAIVAAVTRTFDAASIEGESTESSVKQSNEEESVEPSLLFVHEDRLSRFAQNLASNEDYLSFRKNVTLHPEQQHARILRHLRRERRLKYWKEVKDRISESFVWLLNLFLPPDRPIARAAFITALVVIVAGGSLWGVRYYKTGYRISQAENILTEQHRIYMADIPRLSGGYGSTRSSEPMAGPDSATVERTYLEESRALLTAAIADGDNSEKAKQLLAHILIIKKEYDEAASILNQLEGDSKKSAAVLNDLGVLSFNEQKWDSAASYFEAATKADSRFQEALYNLALAKSKLGATGEAISILTKYLEIETDDGWKNAGQSFLEKLRKKE